MDNTKSSEIRHGMYGHLMFKYEIKDNSSSGSYAYQTIINILNEFPNKKSLLE